MGSILIAPPCQPNLCSRSRRRRRRPCFNLKSVVPSVVVGVKFHPNAFPIPSFRYKNSRGLELSQRSISIAASNSSDGNSSKEESDGSKAAGDAQGPPFLTILAGLFVFSLLLWIISSFITSVIGLVVKLISTN